VVPGPKLQHNLLLSHCTEVTVKDSRLDTSPFGSGLALVKCTNVKVNNCEIARNGYYGLLVTECAKISATGNLIEGNDRSGVMVEFLYGGSEEIEVRENLIHYNNGFGLESYSAKNLTSEKNTYVGNGSLKVQEKLSNDRYIIMH
jgi:nitrous oxidase accessory protein NosD